jgi:glycosyltransferase involved in cell wall biosynthesis
VAQLHTYVVDPGTGRPGAYPAYAASRYNNLIDAYAVISGSIGKRLTSQLYVSPTKIRTIPLGIDVERFARAGRGGRLGGEVAEVLWLGRLSEEKDPLMVVRIAEAWRERHSERRVRFTIVGGGPLEAELRRRAAASPAAGLVELVGPTRDPVPLYERADLLLMTSRFEGTPVVVFEAMAAGVPIIAAVANTEIAEVVSAEDAYLLPRQDDVAAYVDALVRATSAPEDARARAARARSRVRSVEQHAHEMLSLLFPEAPRHRPEPRAGFGDTV